MFRTKSHFRSLHYCHRHPRAPPPSRSEFFFFLLSFPLRWKWTRRGKKALFLLIELVTKLLDQSCCIGQMGLFTTYSISRGSFGVAQLGIYELSRPPSRDECSTVLIPTMYTHCAAACMDIVWQLRLLHIIPATNL